MSDPATDWEPAAPAPLLATDPAKVADFWLDARLTSSCAGIGYVAHDSAGTPVLLILTSEGAASDPAARDRLAGEVNRMHIDTVLARGGQDQDQGRLGGKYRNNTDGPNFPTDPPTPPWVALRYDGSSAAVREAERILKVIELSAMPDSAKRSGPDYRLHWVHKSLPRLTRQWPLPWPGRHDRAGWMTILISWLLMLLLAALAVLIAILLFQNKPPQSVPAPIPITGSASSSSSPNQDASKTPSSSSSSTTQPNSTSSSSTDSSPRPNRKL